MWPSSPTTGSVAYRSPSAAPALQGGVDWAHGSGFYVGTWASTIDDDFLTDTHGVEWDIYGGYKFPLGAGWTGDVGLLQYLYPGESL